MPWYDKMVEGAGGQPGDGAPGAGPAPRPDVTVPHQVAGPPIDWARSGAIGRPDLPSTSVATSLMAAGSGGPTSSAFAMGLATTREAEWTRALASGGLPRFVTERLNAAATGRTPWLATLTPAELLLARTHGLKPLATVSGTCWLAFDLSWTTGHAQGWATALDRLRLEAIAVGANAVVDVRMRTISHDAHEDMDFTLVGTAVRIAGLPASPDPVVATVPALEFVRLLEAGIVPTGIAVGAHGAYIDSDTFPSIDIRLGTQRLITLSNFWERIRRMAHSELRVNAARLGDGVLAHVQFGQLLKRQNIGQSPLYLGRHVVAGTVIAARRGDEVRQPVHTAMDMRDGASAFTAAGGRRHTVYDAIHEQEGAI